MGRKVALASFVCIPANTPLHCLPCVPVSLPWLHTPLLSDCKSPPLFSSLSPLPSPSFLPSFLRGVPVSFGIAVCAHYFSYTALDTTRTHSSYVNFYDKEKKNRCMHVNHQRATCIFLLKTLVLKTLRSVEITRRKSLVTINDNKTPPSFYTYLFVNIYIYIYYMCVRIYYICISCIYICIYNI